jgi:manganese/zinc/iron transport system permease protein
MILLLSDPMVQRVFVSAAVLGALAGLAGVFVVLQGRSLLGDVISHATLPGVCLAWLLTRSDSGAPLVLGGFVAGAMAYLLILSLSKCSSLPNDAALSVTLSLFFGAGLVLLSCLQRLPNGGSAGLESFIFGNLATVLRSDLFFAAATLVGFLIFILIFWQQISVQLFDPLFAYSQFGPLRAVRILIGVFVVATIGVCLQSLGALLVTSILVAPVAAARPWSSGLFNLFLLSSGLGALACVLGTMWSVIAIRVPPGPASTLVAMVFVLVSLGGRRWIDSILKPLQLPV